MIKVFLIAGMYLVGVPKQGCNKSSADNDVNKIDFDITAIDANGMQGGTYVDYEFCIPMDEDKVAEVKSIEPDVVMPAKAKGRIRCSEDEFLCIVSTKGEKWKENLNAIASLSYVKRIIQTYYE